MPKESSCDNSLQADLRFDGQTYDPQADQARLSRQLQGVKDALWSGQWMTFADIKATGVQGTESGISARIRDLRKERFGAFKVERRARGDRETGLFEYQLCRPA